ncbi:MULTISPECIES: hypothetical protein [Paenibacillus]|uniref:hypothetical protein n=1 Tax=Paenibacillus TaxID=44249 RepID=UPI001BCF7972|nr:hypothetical protein [Paenibacillus dendritiformis]
MEWFNGPRIQSYIDAFTNSCQQPRDRVPGRLLACVEIEAWRRRSVVWDALAAGNAPPSPNAGTVDSGSPSRTRPSRASDVELKGGSHRLCSRTSASLREQLKLWKEGFEGARNESWHRCDHVQLLSAKGPRSRTPDRRQRPSFS